MTNTIHTSTATTTDWHESAFDIMRGVAEYTSSPMLKGLARVISHHPEADLGNAFNHKQVACKIWARQSLFETVGGKFRRIVVLGGWYGVLAAMFFDDARFEIEAIDSFDIDPEVGAVAETLNGAWKGRFRALTADMYTLAFAELDADLVINTSCEHIADLPAWLSLLPAGTRVLLQSNDYFSEPTHVNCVSSLEAFTAQASLSKIEFAGALPMKKYTRFMLIGTV
jgi:SAM-dependent methyltransferase